METTQKSAFKTALNYGLMIGLSVIVVSLLFYVLSQSDSKIVQYINYVIMIVGIVMGIKKFRDTELNGYISYGRSLGTGTFIALFAGALASLYFYIFISYIDTEFVSRLLEKTHETMLDQGRSEEQIEMALKYQRKFTTPGMMLLFGLLANVLAGFLFSLIISIFLKKEDKSLEANFR